VGEFGPLSGRGAQDFDFSGHFPVGVLCSLKHLLVEVDFRAFVSSWFFFFFFVWLRCVLSFFALSKFSGLCQLIFPLFSLLHSFFFL